MLSAGAERLRSIWAKKNVRQLVLFGVVGVVNTIFGYGFYALLVWLGLHYELAALISTVLGVLFNFRSIGRFVFQSRDHRLLRRFVAVYTICYGANLAGLWALQKFGINPYWSGALLLLPSAALAFVLQKRFVFTGPALVDR